MSISQINNYESKVQPVLRPALRLELLKAGVDIGKPPGGNKSLYKNFPKAAG
ncbi:hypothetical protein [Leptospira kirschneri]|uniref:hypothetical protein n=1 Tax=Leptospira kirschneri TaxID=29507 RepID=UPI0021C5B461|nr:hypothetical protein [Leptospira kirschneri]UML81928.1 hypothetical protein FH602_10325 [Leptospira kirschneri]